jgi:hypothetical protein
MALLPKVPWTDIDDTRVAVDAPVSTDLWIDTVVDLNYLKATLTDGVLAPQNLNINGLTVAAPSTFNDDVQVNADVVITGTLTVGDFFKSSDLMFLTAL